MLRAAAYLSVDPLTVLETVGWAVGAATLSLVTGAGISEGAGLLTGSRFGGRMFRAAAYLSEFCGAADTGVCVALKATVVELSVSGLNTGISFFAFDIVAYGGTARFDSTEDTSVFATAAIGGIEGSTSIAGIGSPSCNGLKTGMIRSFVFISGFDVVSLDI